ncbi:hypothetical protein [Oceanobacillus alkalisoli]|nr:hypothetical protein [Oceanobacillus alkalisoli]MCF3944228.1 hypothetical protein [Oceanobacillus alkalisoli]
MRKLQFIIFLSIVILLGCTDNIENEDYWAESRLCDSKNDLVSLIYL